MEEIKLSVSKEEMEILREALDEKIKNDKNDNGHTVSSLLLERISELNAVCF